MHVAVEALVLSLYVTVDDFGRVRVERLALRRHRAADRNGAVARQPADDVEGTD